jgi:hypothetical protein
MGCLIILRGFYLVSDRVPLLLAVVAAASTVSAPSTAAAGAAEAVGAAHFDDVSRIRRINRAVFQGLWLLTQCEVVS